jgi:deoxyribodipyrimidine photo-lyase
MRTSSSNAALAVDGRVRCGRRALFRVFNPVSQGEKFDPDGEYVRRWLPELTKFAEQGDSRPLDGGSTVLKKAGVHLGETYPEPIVDHGDARKRALAAFEKIKDSA